MMLSECLGYRSAIIGFSGLARQVGQLIRRGAAAPWAILPAGGEATRQAGGGVVFRAAPPTPPKPRAIVPPWSAHDIFENLGADLAPSYLFAHDPAREYAANPQSLEIGLGV